MSTYSWSRPYDHPDEIISIWTHLPRQWKYSPKFVHSYADVKVAITGKRSIDYKLAEATCGKRHVPGATVWHHVWEEHNGLYTMQLVDVKLHQETCPHAGGCKLWSLKHRNKKYTLARPLRRSSHQDFVLDYVFREGDIKEGRPRAIFQYRKKKRGTLYGLDPYGNLFIKGRNGELYLYNHEEGSFETVDHIIDNTKI